MTETAVWWNAYFVFIVSGACLVADNIPGGKWNMVATELILKLM